MDARELTCHRQSVCLSVTQPYHQSFYLDISPPLVS